MDSNSPALLQALNFWGLSPPIDLIGLHEAGSSAAYPDASAASEAPQKAEELRVLQVGESRTLRVKNTLIQHRARLHQSEPAERASDARSTLVCLTCTQVSPSDCRHTALTIARAARHAKTNVLMYVFQTHMEELARHLLLVSIFLDEEQTMRGELTSQREARASFFACMRPDARNSYDLRLLCRSRGDFPGGFRQHEAPRQDRRLPDGPKQAASRHRVGRRPQVRGWHSSGVFEVRAEPASRRRCHL